MLLMMSEENELVISITSIDQHVTLSPCSHPICLLFLG